ncbi:MAG: single-stranded-DNA-specific exonuclease RecJ [Bacteroidales bacterium]|nr:single-stranded-DNA-specific exonuclease RecJ [Bacteroidales bacterium]
MSMEKRWAFKERGDREIVSSLAKQLCVGKNNAGNDDLFTYEIVAELLVQRGITSYEEAERFFRPKYEHLHNPYLMNDMDKAVERILVAIKGGEKILVYGDYDVDGTSAVALVYSYLERLSSNIDFYIPDRYSEGYGVSVKGVDYAVDSDVKLIVCLDCGIKAHEEILYAKQKGVDFIVCDHHLPSDTLPEAWAVLDPKRVDSHYPYKELSGCGIGFKLIQAIQKERNRPFEEILNFLDLVAISIAADVVPLTGENRVLAYYGLKVINRCPRVGIEAILSYSKIKHESNSKDYFSRKLTISDLVFLVGPRINAAGRMESGRKAVELLKSESREEVEQIAKEIDENNNKRKDLDKKATEEAKMLLNSCENLTAKKTTVVYGKDWHKGVIGIVASRLIEQYYKPTIVFTKSNDLVTGSARSVKDFDIYAAIESCSHLLTHFGGHKFAAGLSLPEKNLEEFKELFEKQVEASISDTQMIPEIEIDMEIELGNITPRLFRILKQFAPFGPENNIPIFCSKRLMDTGFARTVGSKHLKLSAVSREKSSFPFDCIGFGLAEYQKEVSKGSMFDICYQIDENDFQGKTSLQLNLKDMKIIN